MPSFRAPCLLLPLLCSLASCGGYTAPNLVVEDAAVTEQTAEGVVVTFRVRAENRNAEPLPMRTVRYSFSMGGSNSFTGTRSAEATIPRFGTQTITLPVALKLGEGGDLAQIPDQPVAYTLAGNVEYELPGSIAEVLFDTGIRVPTAAFAERGELDFAAPAAPAPAARP
ncbi:MAG: LEA type 2 family protein [Planctomycetota bacterium]|nr:LEA type 2 family protein [Planctomycetota bacterium]